MSAAIILAIRIILVIVLYSFFMLILYSLWKDLRERSRAFKQQHIPTIILEEDEGESVLQHPFTAAEVLIGRAQECDFILSDPAISQRHARLNYRQNQWWVEDFQSKNGTFLNNEPVTLPVVIITGDELKLGNRHFQVVIQPFSA